MRILLDTNILLDIALERREFYRDAKELFLFITKKRIQAGITATSVTDIYYVLNKTQGHQKSIEFLRDLLDFIDIIDVNREVIQNALFSIMTDFEDAVQVEACRQTGIEIIITRNINDFQSSGLLIYRPDQFVQQYLDFKSDD